MSEAERPKSSDKSVVIVQRQVREQLRAMGCERFDLGIRRETGEMLLLEGQGASDIEASIKWLRHENANGAHIYVRPAGAHALSLIDDLNTEAIARLKAEGFEPAAVVETSPNNFQAWLNHGQVLEAAVSTRAAKQLADHFGGDGSSADWRHFGRLAGFTNCKPERQLPSGLQPFARLRSATGRAYSRAPEFVALTKNDEHEPRTGENPRTWPHRLKESGDLKPLNEFHAAPVYRGDLHRADLAWAIHAAGCGLTHEQIKTELLVGRDLKKKGSYKRQIEYADRTARKALEQVPG